MDAERFLTNTISILASSADLPTTVENLACLASTELVDCCAVFTFENEQTIRRVALAGKGKAPSNGHPVDTLHPLDLHANSGPGHVLRSGEFEILHEIAAQDPDLLGVKPEELRALCGPRVSSYLGMPIIARGRTIGSIAFFSAEIIFGGRERTKLSMHPKASVGTRGRSKSDRWRS